jgi:transposase, IS30 family
MGQNYTSLSLPERTQIQLLKEQGWTCRAIARQVHRATSTITRELDRNVGGAKASTQYVAHAAQGMAASRRLHARVGVRKLGATFDTPLGRWVRGDLELAHSPEQVAGRLRAMHPDKPELHISHETIYRSIYVLTRGSMRTELIALLRRRHDKRLPRARGASRAGAIVNPLCIAQRPPEVDDRRVAGHWEGDFIKGAFNRSAVGVLMERTSRMVLLCKMDGCTAEDALAGYSRRLRQINPDLRKTLTYDRGSEMALHEQLADRLNIDVYFCDPHSPWQRASNENFNGLLRQYLPKGMDLSTVTHQQLAYIEMSLNNRPRAMHGFLTPLEVFSKCLNEYHQQAFSSMFDRVALQH